MLPGQRRPDRPSQVPGDLYLDPTLPAGEHVLVACGEWSAPATHVWTGSGWARLGGPVRPVPAAVALLGPRGRLELADGLEPR